MLLGGMLLKGRVIHVLLIGLIANMRLVLLRPFTFRHCSPSPPHSKGTEIGFHWVMSCCLLLLLQLRSIMRVMTRGKNLRSNNNIKLLIAAKSYLR